MRNALKILKEQDIKVTINYSNGDVAKGYIQDYDRMGFVYTIGMLSPGPYNDPHFVPWVAIKDITREITM